MMIRLITLSLLVVSAFAQLRHSGYHAEPGMPTLPARGHTLVDSVFGTTIMRLTDATDSASGCSVSYGMWPVFNYNSTKIIIHCTDVTYLWNFNAATMRITKRVTLPAAFTSTDDLIWSHSDPNIIYYRMAYPDSPCAFGSFNISTMKGSVVHDFQNEFPATPPGQPFGCTLWRATMSENDDMYCAERRLFNNDTNPNDGWVCYKLPTHHVYSEPLEQKGHYFKIHVDKTGQWLWNVASGGTSLLPAGRGGESINIATGATDFMTQGAPDYTPGHGVQGPGWVIGVENTFGRDTRRSWTDVHTFTVVKSPGLNEDSGSREYSMLNVDNSDYTTISQSFGWPHSPTCAFCNEVYTTAVDGTQAVRRYVHHFNRADGTPAAYDYRQIPQASMSYDHRFVAFVSNWGGSGRTDVFVFATGLTAGPGVTKGSRTTGNLKGK